MKSTKSFFNAGVSIAIALFSISAFAENEQIKQRIRMTADHVSGLARSSQLDLLNAEELREVHLLLARARRLLRIENGPIPEPVSGYFIQAQVSDLDVSFDGDSLDAVFQQCSVYMREISKSVYQVTINGEKINLPTSLSDDQVCALMALNAVPLASDTSIELNAKVKELPVTLKVSTRMALNAVLDTYVPKLLGSSSVYKITINGVTYNASTSYSKDAVVGILKANQRDAYSSFVSEGNIASVFPFIFNGNTPSELEGQCLEYVKTVVGTKSVYEVTVNGQKRNSSTSFKAVQLCMLVKSLAKSNF